MKNVIIMILIAVLALSVLPFVSSANYVVDGQFHWACLTKGEGLARYVCKFDCCRTCQKNGYTYPDYYCSGPPCGCGSPNPGDFEPPLMDVVLPVDGMVSDTRSIPFLVELNERANIYYNDTADERRGFRKICSNCEKYNRKISFSDGPHTVIIKSVDSSDNEVVKDVSFFVDSKKPRIKKTSPKRRGYTDGTFVVQYSEDNLENITLMYDQGFGYNSVVKDDCPSGRSAECTFFVDSLSNVPLSYYFVVNDKINSVESKEVKGVNVDTEDPILTVTEPYTTAYSRYAIFDIKVTEDVTLEYMDNSEKYHKWRRLCSRCDDYARKKSFSKGDHNLLIRATDPAGNFDESSVLFTVT